MNYAPRVVFSYMALYLALLLMCTAIPVEDAYESTVESAGPEARVPEKTMESPDTVLSEDARNNAKKPLKAYGDRCASAWKRAGRTIPAWIAQCIDRCNKHSAVGLFARKKRAQNACKNVRGPFGCHYVSSWKDARARTGKVGECCMSIYPRELKTRKQAWEDGEEVTERLEKRYLRKITRRGTLCDPDYDPYEARNKKKLHKKNELFEKDRAIIQRDMKENHKKREIQFKGGYIDPAGHVHWTRR